MEKPSYFHTLDADVWEEISVRKVGANGYVYVGRKYHDEYEARVFLKKKELSIKRSD